MKKLWNLYSYAIILFVLSFITALIMIIQLGGSGKSDYIKITVNEGDTLWQIAEEFSNEHTLSVKEFVVWVEQNNGILSGRIFPGDELVIPVVQENSAKKPTELASSQN
ncbi:LysM peptidoglycan-binding domain-containing protein [Bacillus sp. FJAT-49705]|uniref:LysM peptidoglycan-binding domain-containing protein n=1 Tax=Cytobacillus citreus TaxID=2833586 RepID=A0ABS5NND1_9BACI|nr:LysM peptidoglycan-binding domain-containing protein [Cytobacillus citreus]MBS4189337.1 LysM peptidoglycan-binding domain-containing protein [Cytobacillus citreus]